MWFPGLNCIAVAAPDMRLSRRGQAAFPEAMMDSAWPMRAAGFSTPSPAWHPYVTAMPRNREREVARLRSRSGRGVC